MRVGLSVVWPKGLEELLDISAPTRWRWERSGKLPLSDVTAGGKSGWKPATLEAIGLIATNQPASAANTGVLSNAKASRLSAHMRKYDALIDLLVEQMVEDLRRQVEVGERATQSLRTLSMMSGTSGPMRRRRTPR